MSELKHGESVTDSFEYTISNGNGHTDIATITIVVHGINTDPAAEDDLETTDMTVSASVLPNDSDPGADTLTVSSVNDEGLSGGVGTEITLPLGATVTMSSDGDFTYDPKGQFDSLREDESGTDTFSYAITDGNAGYATATVTIVMPGVNESPDALDDLGRSPAGESASHSLFSNDRHPECDELTLTINGETVLVDGTTTITSLAPGETAMETFA